ncbi:MAG: hypothetical protein Q4F13_15480 [Pseudomonadota bacterium]|nr:hypothetical protein [Pseudomonadota bacterium]
MLAPRRSMTMDNAAAPDGLVYVKTQAGREALATLRSQLNVRERQILLLCTGERNLAALQEVFGASLWSALQQLVARGLVELQPRHKPLPEDLVQPYLMPDYGLTLPPLDFAASRSANQSGFSDPCAQTMTVFHRMHTETAKLLAELGGAEALQLHRTYAGAGQEEDVLAFTARAIALLERHWGEQRAIDCACRIAHLLPRATKARLLDALIDHAGSSLPLSLYDMWLSNCELQVHEGAARSESVMP